jgi:hypothetical protein
VRLFFLGRGFRNGFGFFLFLVGMALPLVLIREWKGLAVAVIAGALIAFSVFPELVPAFSGVCNLGVFGLFFGLILLGILPGVRWLRHVTARWALPALLVAIVMSSALFVSPPALAGEEGQRFEQEKRELIGKLLKEFEAFEARFRRLNERGAGGLMEKARRKALDQLREEIHVTVRNVNKANLDDLALLSRRLKALTDDEPKVYIPYDPKKAEKGIPVKKVFLPYREFLRLWDLAFPGQATKPVGPEAPFAHVRARYECGVAEGWLTGKAVFHVSTRGSAPVEVPLGMKGAMVEKASVNGQAAALRETKTGYAFAAPKAGTYTLELDFRAKTQGDEKWGRAVIGLFPIPRSTAVVRLSDPVLTCEVPSALGGLERVKDPKGEVVVAHLGAADRLVVEVLPKEAERGSEVASLKTRTRTILAVEPGTQRVFHTCDFEVVGSPREDFQFELARDLKVLHVKGPNIRSWGFPEGDRRILEIDLLKPEEKGGSYTIEALRSLEGGAREGALPLLRPMHCMRERGSLVVECPARIRLGAKRGSMLEPVEKRALRPWKHPVTAAYRFTERPLDWSYTLEDKPERLEGQLRLSMIVGEEDVRLGAVVHVASRGAPAFRMTTTLPEGFRLDRVEAVYGPRIKDWWIEDGEKERLLQIRLQQGLRERTAMGFVVWMSRKVSLDKGPQTLAFPSLVLRRAELYKGHIVVLSTPGVHLEARDLDGLNPANAWIGWREFCSPVKRGCPPIPSEALGYSFDGTHFKGAIVAEAETPVLACQWVLHQRIRKDAVEYGLYLTYTAEKAPAKVLAFSLPDSIPPERVVIPHFRGKRGEDPPKSLPGGRILYRVRLQRGFMGAWRLAAHVVLPLGEGEAAQGVAIPRLAPEGVGGSVKGYVIVENDETRAQLHEKGLRERLTRIGTEELVKNAALPPGVKRDHVTIAYRAEAEYRGIIRMETPEVVKGVDVEVGRIEMLTVIRKEGASWNRATFRLTNRSRQFLEVVMPKESKLLSLFVNGRAARPGRAGETTLLVPLPKGTMVDPSFPVEIVYTQPLRKVGYDLMALKHPTLQDEEIKVGKILWTVRAPEGFRYGFTGDMNDTEKKSLEELKTKSEAEETGQMILNIEDAPAVLRNRAVTQAMENWKLSVKNLDQRERQGLVNKNFARQQRAQHSMQRDALTEKFQGQMKFFEQERKKLQERDIRLNAAKFTANQEGVRADAWAVLEPERASWDFGEELRGKPSGRPWSGGGFTPQSTLPPPSAVGGNSMVVPFPSRDFREFHFIKEAKTAELNLRPWPEGALHWLWTLVKFAAVILVFLAALFMGWLREAEGWPYRRVWIWMVLLVVCGAALSSWPFAVAVGLIAGFLAFREGTRIKEERERLKRDYVV